MENPIDIVRLKGAYSRTGNWKLYYSCLFLLFSAAVIGSLSIAPIIYGLYFADNPTTEARSLVVGVVMLGTGKLLVELYKDLAARFHRKSIV